MTDRLAGRTALVLGGGHGDPDCAVVGIGFATATTSPRHGAAVVVVDRDADAADARSTRCAARAAGQAVVADMTVPDDVERAVAEALRAFGRIDVVHNNVGATRLGGPEELTLEEWRATFAVNLDSVYLGVPDRPSRTCSTAAASIINVSSTASIRWTGYPYPAYAAAKAAVNQLTRSLALQYADRACGSTRSWPG